MDFTRLAKAIGALGIVALVAGIALWLRDNSGDRGYFQCLYSTSYKWEGHISAYSNPRWNPDKTACRKNETALNPPLLNGIGIGLLLLAFVIGYASSSAANPSTPTPIQHRDATVPQLAPAPAPSEFEGQSEEELLRSLGSFGYTFERRVSVTLASKGQGSNYLYSRADIVRLLEAELANHARVTSDRPSPTR